MMPWPLASTGKQPNQIGVDWFFKHVLELEAQLKQKDGQFKTAMEDFAWPMKSNCGPRLM